MMKEWKDNPGSDEESAADRTDRPASPGPLEGCQPSVSSGNVPGAMSTSDEDDEEKQVGSAAAGKGAASVPSSAPFGLLWTGLRHSKALPPWSPPPGKAATGLLGRKGRHGNSPVVGRLSLSQLLTSNAEHAAGRRPLGQAGTAGARFGPRVKMDNFFFARLYSLGGVYALPRKELLHCSLICF